LANSPQEKESQQVFEEYHAYAGSKARLLDEVFIEGFDTNTVLWMARRYGWKPLEEEEISAPSSSVSTASFDGTSPTMGPVDLPL
jgi:tyrosine-protein phosphatase SIW14